MNLVHVYKETKDLPFEYMNHNNEAFLRVDHLLERAKCAISTQSRLRFLRTISTCAQLSKSEVKTENAYSLFGSNYVRHDLAALWCMSIRLNFKEKINLYQDILKVSQDAQNVLSSGTLYLAVPVDFLQKPSGVCASVVRQAFYELSKKDRSKKVKKLYEEYNSYTKVCRALGISYRTLKRYLAK